MGKHESKAFMKYVARRALEAVALPGAEREAYFARMEAAAARVSAPAGLSQDAVGELAGKSVEFARQLVSVIEAGGGAAGGRA